MDRLLQALDDRWSAMFRRLAAGDDLPPAQRLRTEGLMEAAVLLRIATEEELVQRMDDAYRAAFGEHLATALGADWQAFFPFPQVPAMARRAPVFPSTRD